VNLIYSFFFSLAVSTVAAISLAAAIVDNGTSFDRIPDRLGSSLRVSLAVFFQVKYFNNCSTIQSRQLLANLISGNIKEVKKIGR